MSVTTCRPILIIKYKKAALSSLFILGGHVFFTLTFMVKYAKIKGTYRAENRAPFISLRKYRNLPVSLQTAPAEQIARLGFGKGIAVYKV